MVKNLPARRFPGVGNGNPLYNILAWKIPWTDWWATVQGIAKNQTQLSTGAQTYINTHTHTHTHTHSTCKQKISMGIMQSGKSQCQRFTYCAIPLIQYSQSDKTLVIESRSEVAKVGGRM